MIRTIIEGDVCGRVRSKLDGICVCFALSTRCINQTTGMAWTEWKMHALMGGASIGEIEGKIVSQPLEHTHHFTKRRR